MTVSTLPDELRLTHLKQLETEAIHIMREVVAQFERPVMLYSIGKDSSVLLHLARKAFFPGPLPFPLVHVNTTWKFREMIEFRDRIVQEMGLELISWTNQEGIEKGINPFDHGSKNYTDIMKTQALKQALDAGGYDAAFGGARRDEEKSRAKERVFSFRDKFHRWDPKISAPSSGASTTAGSTGARAFGSSPSRIGPSSTSGSTSTWRTSTSSRCTSQRPARL